MRSLVPATYHFHAAHQLYLATAAPTDKNLALALKVLPALCAILLVSALCGRLALLLWQPRVLGEMVAGVLLGPSLFGWVLPHQQAQLFPTDVKPILYIFSTMGLALYMFLVGAGLETQDGGLAKDAGKAVILSASGLLPALFLGGGLGYLLWTTLSPSSVDHWLFAAFVGGALAITAFPMLARILYERGLENSPLGKLTLIAGAIDDVVAWCALAVLSAIHLGDGSGALRTIGLGVVFTVVALGVVRPLLRPLGRRVARDGFISDDAMYLVLLVPLAAGWLTDWIGVYSVFGGFVAGLCMPRDPAFRELLHGRMMAVVSTLILPVFFAFSGLNTQLGGLGSVTLLLCCLALLAVGFIAKYLGCALTMRRIGFGWRESYAVGGLMNARGLMILIFINIGLAEGIITQKVFSMLVIVAIGTTAAALPLYRLALPARLEGELSADSLPEGEKLAAA